MEIAINAAAAFNRPRAGVEEYTYQLIKHLAMLEESQKHRFLLYAPAGQIKANRLNWNLPKNFKLVGLAWPFLGWTQIRLAAEFLFNQPPVLLIPVHVLPCFSPKKSVVVIHGLEYEYYPQMYPRMRLNYLRWSTKNALKRADKIIAVSQNTKKDLMDLYRAEPSKIFVVHHGWTAPARVSKKKGRPYILYLGRLESKKNITGLVQAFDLFKQKYQTSHRLVLAGPAGYGYQAISRQLSRLKHRGEIVETGYLSQEQKWQMLSGADLFVWPSFYEGFGMPILEAQALACPVITSNLSSLPEIAGQGALLVNPKGIEEIAENMYKVISDRNLRNRLIEQGRQNLKRFSWRKCARQTLEAIINQSA